MESISLVEIFGLQVADVQAIVGVQRVVGIIALRDIAWLRVTDIEIQRERVVLSPDF